MKYASLKETAEYFGVSYGIIRQMCVEGIIPHIRFGMKYKVNLEEAEKILLSGEGLQRKKQQHIYRPAVGRNGENFLAVLKSM